MEEIPISQNLSQISCVLLLQIFPQHHLRETFARLGKYQACRKYTSLDVLQSLELIITIYHPIIGQFQSGTIRLVQPRDPWFLTSSFSPWVIKECWECNTTLVMCVWTHCWYMHIKIHSILIQWDRNKWPNILHLRLKSKLMFYYVYRMNKL